MSDNISPVNRRVAEMRQITGVSGNSLERAIKVLKLLGWFEFYGNRKNGYFTHL